MGRVEEFAAQLGSDIVLQCDVAEDTSIDTMFAELGKVWPKFDGFVHSIGFAPGDQLDGDYVKPLLVKASKLPTTSAPTASLQWQKLAAPC